MTDLPADEFPLSALKELYAMRWGVETSFRDLKYTVGLLCFHSKKSSFILQEIWARLTMYNFIAFITDREAVHIEGNKYAYQKNFANAAHICRSFFQGFLIADNLAPLLMRCQSPVRPGRSSPRKPRVKAGVGHRFA